MALVKPPKSTLERRAEELIDKAPAVHTSNSKGTEDPHADQVPVTVRIPKAMLRDIEKLVRKRPIKTPRHTWLMEALYEKWKRETGAGESNGH